jgi:hypothetical protein
MIWANNILGPSRVALYNPLQPACSTLLSTSLYRTPMVKIRQAAYFAYQGPNKIYMDIQKCHDHDYARLLKSRVQSVYRSSALGDDDKYS